MADYSIAAVTRRAVYTGSAGTGPYAFSFACLATSDIAVYVNTSLKTETSDYSVTLSATTGTGSVTLGSAASGSDTVTLVGSRALARTTDFVTSGSLTASALNTDFDSLVIFAQQLSEENSRNLKAPVTEGISGTTDMTIPAKAARLGKLLQFNSSTGNPEVTTFELSGITASSAELNILDGCTLTTGELNQFDGFTIADEDNMSSNSATKLATQQSIKAYVDTVIATEDTLAEMNDTNITSAADASLLLYDTGTSTWIDNVMSGDATMADTGVLTIASGAVETAMLAADSVTAAKIGDDVIDSEHYAAASVDFALIQNVAANSILGRNANSSGVLSEVALATTQILIGDGTGFTAAALSGDVTMTNAGVVTIAGTSVETGMIAADAITGAKIADDAIDSEHYTDGSIDTAHIADLNVTTGKIAADAITAAKIADDAISEEHLDPTIISAMADTTIAAADYLLFWDADDSALKKVDAAELGVGSSLTSLAGDSSPQLGGTLDVNGNLIDMNGLADGLVLDADGDTTISSPTDDQIDFEIAGADDFRMTANSFNILSGSTLTVDSGATITNSGTANGFGGTVRPNSKAIIINGDMQVAQRSTSEASLGDGDEGYVTVDRVRHTIGATSAGRFTSARTAITDLSGFSNCLHLDCTTADASIAAGELFTLDWRIEGQDLQMAKKGHSDAEAITISFYMKAEDAKVYVIELVDTDNTRHIAQTFTSATSWTQHVLSFAGDTTGKITNDNAESLRVRMWLHAGSTYTGGTLASSWASTTNANSAAGIGSFFDNTNNDIKISGMQLEIGSYTTSTIPNFQHESYGDNFSRCQRYFQKYTQPPLIGSANANNTMARARMGLFPTQFRAAPTATQSGTMSWFYSNSHQPTSTAFSATYLDVDCFEADITVSGTGMTATHPCGVFQSGSAYVQFDAEL